MNLFSILEEGATKWPEDTAVVHGTHSFTYADLHAAAESLAAKLREAGVRAWDKVGVISPGSVECIVSYFAVLRAGGIVVPISPALKAPEVAQLADDLAFDALCYTADFNLLVPAGKEHSLVKAPIFKSRAPLCIKLAASRHTSPGERDQLQKINAACIAFSSGTTSKAKGIIFSHATILEHETMCPQTPPITKSSSVLWLRRLDRNLPHAFWGCLLGGAKIVLANALAVDSMPRLVSGQNIEQIYAGPLFFRALIQGDFTREDFRGVRHFISGGSPLPNSVAQAFRAKFGRAITQGYGLTECGGVLRNAGEDVSKRGSVGTAVPGREVKLGPLVSVSAGAEEIGEILARGPGMFDAYYRPWRLREEVLEDGWFRTGDVARRDADGYYWIVGRTKDVINVGGVKVFPYEIEEALLSHPAVEEAVVFGVPEGRFGEAPHAKVKLRSGAVCPQKELLRHVNERLSVFKALRGVEFVGEIPKAVGGKLRRWD